MAQLRRFAAEFEKRGTRIVLISFGEEHWARAFLEETGSPFPLLLDPQMESYRAFGLHRSVARTYAPATIWYYLKALLSGRKIHLKARGDAHQMGGDVLVGRDGRLLYRYCSRQPADRPAVQRLLEVLDEAETQA